MSANQQIKAAHARNLAVQRSRLASVPEVGIFWLIDNKLLADSIPWRQADIDGGFYSGKNDHAALWTCPHLSPGRKTGLQDGCAALRVGDPPLRPNRP
jgi:hypothetical protein